MPRSSALQFVFPHLLFVFSLLHVAVHCCVSFSLSIGDFNEHPSKWLLFFFFYKGTPRTHELQCFKVNCLPLIILNIDFHSLCIIDLRSLSSFPLWPIGRLSPHWCGFILSVYGNHESVTHTLVSHLLSPAFSAFPST